MGAVLNDDRPRILTVCTGNVCRSPYMERVLRQIVDRAWGPGAVVVESAGTGALVGQPMDRGSESILRAAGVDADGFVARQIERDHVAASDLVLTATRTHRGPVAQLHPRALRYTFAIGDFVDLANSIPDDALPATDDAGEWIRGITQLVAGRRGLVSPRHATEIDVVDPFRRDQSVFEEMAARLDSLRPSLTRALGRAGLARSRGEG